MTRHNAIRSAANAALLAAALLALTALVLNTRMDGRTRSHEKD